MRTEFERRPALLLLIGLIVGLTALTFLANCAVMLLGMCTLRTLPARFCLAFAFCIGVLLAPQLPQEGLTSPKAVNGRFTVISPPTRLMSGGSSFQVESNGERLEIASASLVPVLGDDVTIEGTAKPPPEQFARTYLARGVTGVVTPNSAQVAVVAHAGGIMAWGAAWRESFIDFCNRRLSGEDAGVVSALAFDVRTGLSLSTRTSLEQSGTVHVLAASGLHLLTLAWFLEFLLLRFPVPYLVRRTIILALCGLFSAAGGLHPGTFRAWISTAMRDGSVMAGRSFDGVSALGVAGVLYLLWRPNMVYDAGFQLSMVLGAGIAIFRSQTSGTAILPRLAKGSLSIWLLSVPIVANLFGVVSIVSIPANLLATAILPFCFLGLLAGHAASFVSEAISQVIMVPTVLAAHGLESIVHFFGLSRAWGFHVPPFNGYFLVPIYGVALALWRPKERPVS